MIDILVSLNSVADHLRKVAGRLRPLRPDEQSLLLQAASRAENIIKANWPVRTGESRDGWQVLVEGLGLRFVNRVDYAEYVHFSGEVHTAWAEAFAYVDEWVIDPLVAGLKALITANGGERPRSRFEQATQALASTGVIRLVPVGVR